MNIAEIKNGFSLDKRTRAYKNFLYALEQDLRKAEEAKRYMQLYNSLSREDLLYIQDNGGACLLHLLNINLYHDIWRDLKTRLGLSWTEFKAFGLWVAKYE